MAVPSPWKYNPSPSIDPDEVDIEYPSCVASGSDGLSTTVASAIGCPLNEGSPVHWSCPVAVADGTVIVVDSSASPPLWPCSPETISEDAPMYVAPATPPNIAVIGLILRSSDSVCSLVMSDSISNAPD